MYRHLLVLGLLVAASTAYTQNQLVSWSNSVGGSLNDVVTGFTVDNTGNQFITGYFNGGSDFDPGVSVVSLISVGVEDVFISKMDAPGTLAWARSLGSVGKDFATKVAVDQNGGVLITGGFSGTVDFDPGAGIVNLSSVGGLDIFVVKLNTNGNFVWAKVFGGPGDDYGQGIATDQYGNVHVASNFYGTVDFSPGAAEHNLTAMYVDVAVVKLSPSGNFIWAKRMGGPFTDSPTVLTVDNEGNVYTAGHFLGWPDFDPGDGVALLASTADADVFISKLDASGNFVWVKQFTTPSYYSSRPYALALDRWNNLYIAGQYGGRPDVDPGPGTFYFPQATGGSDGFLVKLDPTGSFVWGRLVGGCNGLDAVYSIVTDHSGDIYTAGVFTNIADFDPGPGVYTLQCFASVPDGFICKFNPGGDFVWAKQIGGNDSYDYGYGIAKDGQGNIYNTGTFAGNAILNPDVAASTVSSSGGSDIWITKYDADELVALPVTFDAVSAFPEAQGVRIKWSNMTEEQVVDYNVERSEDGQSFTALAKLPAQRNDGNAAHFSFFDALPKPGVNFYRILCRETNGKETRSNIVSVSLAQNLPSFTTYPNPVINGLITINGNALQRGTYNMEIHNMAGGLIFKSTINVNGPSITHTLQLPRFFSAGVYQIRLIHEKSMLSNMFIVK